MTKEQAYEKLELPVGTDLQVVRQKFQQMHNDFQVQIDGAFNVELKQRKEQQLEELKEAYAVLNESRGMDDSASLPRTEKTFDQTGGEAKKQTAQQQNALKEPQPQQAPPPPPPRAEKEQPQEQAPPAYTPPPAKRKSNAGLFIGIAAAVIVVLAGFYFLSNRSGSTVPSTVTADPRQDSTAWEAALAGGNATSYAHYLKQYPQGIFAQTATDSLTQLKGADYAATIVEEAKEHAIVTAADPELQKTELATKASSSAHTKALIQEGRKLVDKEQYKQAEAKLREALNAGDTNAVPYLAGALHGLKRYKEVIQMIDRYPAYHGNAIFQLHIARAYDWLERYKACIPWYTKSANQGNTNAQYNLALKYENGLGVSKSDSEAVKWYRKAADQGYVHAQNNLGVMYRDGKGITKDEAEAVKWYTKAANQGLDIAQNNLGNMYRDGKGVTKSESEAVKWYRKSAAQGNTSAQASMGRAYHYGLGMDKDFQQAEKFYTQAAKSGNKWSAERLTDLGYDIEKETKDYCRAKELYQKGIDLGQDGYAYFRLGQLHYFAGRCGGGGYAEAKRLWLIAFDKKERSAAANLGFMYFGGFGVDVDYIQAEKYLLKSLEFGLNNGFPEYRLGQIYREGGHGIVQDTEKANEYFAIAKKKGYTGS
ncbi:tetratricopeptide repeat protein [Sphingobacterium sp. FBM7-1]|uniref:SEL1-like repeat protein n=1 Tax=Sphingobacterium sp. FBM7-1 TaxID=2886688 RepID=UPI001D0F9777|nr:tetratricopeptide repeat protein [Sphingobacterium sp. FBM7-1]MCC2599666.1 sel1 repeat family protein [Sphingobacterium sp. FBM7-1]